MSVPRCAVKLSLRLFQKAFTKILLYLMAIGHTVAPRSKAPFLNITVYSLLTQVPSGKTSSGLLSLVLVTWDLMRSATSVRSFASDRLNQMHPRHLRQFFCRKPTQPAWTCMMAAKGV